MTKILTQFAAKKAQGTLEGNADVFQKQSLDEISLKDAIEWLRALLDGLYPKPARYLLHPIPLYYIDTQDSAQRG